MSIFSYSKVSIIQSLEDGEFASGTELHGYLNGLREDNSALPQVELTNVKSSSEFLQEVDGIVTCVRDTGSVPILQLELHGWQDKTGLAFPDDSSLDWHELGEALAKLNKTTGFNLMVCVGTCFGAHFLGALRPLRESPCVALIGPTHKTDGAELLGAFRGFYRVLFETRSIDAAFAEAKQMRLQQGSFLMQDAEYWFFRVVEGYLREKCTRAMLFKRAAAGIAQLEKEGLPAIGFALAVKLQVDRALNLVDRAFAAYFMTAEIPENAARYAESLTRARASAQAFFNAEKLDLH